MTSSQPTPFGKLISFLDRLEASKVWYRMEHIRDSVMIFIAIPGGRWEVEFFEDGHVEVERFLSSGEIEGEEVLEQIFVEDEADSGEIDAHG